MAYRTADDRTSPSDAGPHKTSGSHRLYLAVVVAIACAVLVGVVNPAFAVKCKPLGDIFVRLVKMLLGPIVFCTVVLGISSLGDLKKVGRVGMKALAYFEFMTTFALGLGLAVVHLVKPGVGMHINRESLHTEELDKILEAGAKHDGAWSHILALVPESPTAAFAKGDALQIMLLAVLFGVGLASIGARGNVVTELLHSVLAVLFKMIATIMFLAPVGAFGAMAFTVGTHGIASLLPLVKLMLAFYITALTFVFVVLGIVCRLAGIRVLRLVRYLKDELLLVLGTSSSESALPTLMSKLESLGCAPGVVRLVVPTGYSFNLDGTCIYLTMAAIFVAQALDVHLTVGDELLLLVLLLLTSKGAAAVTGGGFVTLAATLGSTGTIPVSGLSLLLGIDRFMSEARALTNLMGNAVATVVVSRWENNFDEAQAHAALGMAKAKPTIDNTSE